jgi:hypothetical protein
VQYIETSPHRKGSAYYAVYRYLLGDFEPYIYKTDNYGQTWTRLTDGKNGIPADWPTRVVREDPDREGLLYAGTEFGMFISFDNGAHWQHFDQNMPQVPITDIKRHHGDLIVSTQGRSMWIMDDVTPLTQVTPQTATASAMLFKPRETVRARIGGGRGGFGGGGFGGGGGRGGDTGQPQFAAYGATINYYLARPTPVSIEILDAANKVVRTVSSEAAQNQPVAEATPAENADEENPGPRRGAPRVRLTANAGMNRLTWDFNNDAGFMVPPGAYQVKMTAGSSTVTEPLTLTMDPRLAADHITAADLREQYEHNNRMRDMVTEVTRLASRVRAERTKVQGAADAHAQEVRAIATTLFGAGEGIRYGQPGLQTNITYLAGMTTRVDQKVGQDAIDRYKELRKQLDAVEARAKKVLP